MTAGRARILIAGGIAASAIGIAVAVSAPPPPSGACDVNATTATFASAFSAATGGQTICLASGSYGAFNGGAKSSMVTVQAGEGQNVNFSGSNFTNTVRNVTVKNINYTGTICIRPPSGVRMNLILDGITIGNVGQGCNEGRIGIIGTVGVNAIDGNGVQIKNSTIGGVGTNGCSDGIQDDVNGTEIGPNNQFVDILMGGCSVHVDSLQPYASNYIHIHDNYFRNVEQGIMAPDGLSTGYLIENNVIDMAATDNYMCMQLGHVTLSTIRHNVCINSGGINLYGGNEGQNSTNSTLQDNVSNINTACSPGCTISNNLSPNSVTFVGPTGTFCGYRTASPIGTGHDGTSIGLLNPVGC